MNKSCSLKLKGIEESKGIVEFYFSSFGNKDSDGDIMEKGSFKKTISENLSRIKHFKNHNPHLAVGRILELHEDSKGAYAVSQMSKSTLGQDTLIEYFGDVDCHWRRLVYAVFGGRKPND